MAGHTGATEIARRGLLSADPATREAALRAVSRLGHLTSSDLLSGLRDPDQSVVRGAIEIAAHGEAEVASDPTTDQESDQDRADQLGGEQASLGAVDHVLLTHLQGTDPVLAEVAAWSLGERWQEREDEGVDDVVRALVHATQTHAEPLVREAAVSALGAVGQPSALPAVLSALQDKATIRRRAVIALAAFEGPEVDEALNHARSDRDWQVRQSAEDLLQ